ncbi:hypothetical protein SAMN05216289_1247 [Dokdonella immobilis]|uniref:Uncharacterized protein n=1 Tax=Dokdonella immobilis TaxID=578942 RepID=A0A1I4ZA12_9GAMM|nr:hypothetical protein SAMN05216289_1247 [Dokdonella immobilis]
MEGCVYPALESPTRTRRSGVPGPLQGDPRVEGHLTYEAGAACRVESGRCDLRGRVRVADVPIGAGAGLAISCREEMGCPAVSSIPAMECLFRPIFRKHRGCFGSGWGFLGVPLACHDAHVRKRHRSCRREGAFPESLRVGSHTGRIAVTAIDWKTADGLFDGTTDVVLTLVADAAEYALGASRKMISVASTEWLPVEPT